MQNTKPIRRELGRGRGRGRGRKIVGRGIHLIKQRGRGRGVELQRGSAIPTTIMELMGDPLFQVIRYLSATDIEQLCAAQKHRLYSWCVKNKNRIYTYLLYRDFDIKYNGKNAQDVYKQRSRIGGAVIHLINGDSLVRIDAYNAEGALEAYPALLENLQKGDILELSVPRSRPFQRTPYFYIYGGVEESRTGRELRPTFKRIQSENMDDAIFKSNFEFLRPYPPNYWDNNADHQLRVIRYGVPDDVNPTYKRDIHVNDMEINFGKSALNKTIIEMPLYTGFAYEFYPDNVLYILVSPWGGYDRVGQGPSYLTVRVLDDANSDYVKQQLDTQPRYIFDDFGWSNE